MKDWQLTDNSDLKIADGVDWIVSDEYELQQRLKTRLRFFYGEWYRDITEGVDYYGKIFIKNPDYSLVAQEFRRVILLTSGVTEILEFEMKQSDTNPRGLELEFTVQSIYSDEPVGLQLELP